MIGIQKDADKLQWEFRERRKDLGGKLGKAFCKT